MVFLFEKVWKNDYLSESLQIRNRRNMIATTGSEPIKCIENTLGTSHGCNKSRS